MIHTFTLALCGGLVYLAVWALYHKHQQRKHAAYREEHAQERMRRTDYDIKFPSRTDAEETWRRATWDGKHGHLMTAMEIRNREESRWPLGNAFQGLAGLVTGLLIATLVWDGRNPAARPEHQQTIISPPGSTAIVAGDGTSGYDSVFLLSLVLLGSGALFWKLSNTKLGAGVGGGLILTASLFSGLKILGVEKFISIDKVDKIFGVDIHTGSANPPAPPASAPASAPQTALPSTYTLAITLPAFSSGSAIPSPRMLCAVQHIAADMERMPGLFSVVVVAGTDRQELNPPTRKLYANNWALAQQRGLTLEKLLMPKLPSSANILVANAGPTHTAGPNDTGLMEHDRTPSLQLTGLGALPPGLQNLAKMQWADVCKI